MGILKRIHNDERGLTAIELAVVSAILVVLAAIVAMSTTGMSTTARGASKKTDIAEVQKAVDRWVAEQPNSYYPIYSPSASISVSATIAFSQTMTTPEGTTKSFVSDFLQANPKHYGDQTYNSGSWWILSGGTVTNTLADGSY